VRKKQEVKVHARLIVNLCSDVLTAIYFFILISEHMFVGKGG
jgi:hypothetical protein